MVSTGSLQVKVVSKVSPEVFNHKILYSVNSDRSMTAK